MFPGVFRQAFGAASFALIVLLSGAVSAPMAKAQYVPASHLDPAAATITLDSSFQDDAWLVYTYDIDEDGRVTNAVIRKSNEVPELEEALLDKVRAMRFTPAMQDGKPVVSSANPVSYMWILDKQREMGADFAELYRQAWAQFSAQDYAAAAPIAEQLGAYPGRNALEEVKARTLLASLAHRSDDGRAELRHLQRIVDFQSLAQRNNFKHSYVPADQYVKMLDRIMTLQLQANSLADAGRTLDTMQSLARGEAIVQDAARHYLRAREALAATVDVAIEGELEALYPGSQGSWKVGLFKPVFYLSDIEGRVGSAFLTCAAGQRLLQWPSTRHWRVPNNWGDCELEVSGKAGTRLILHQADDAG